jgi:hypothetical protein
MVQPLIVSAGRDSNVAVWTLDGGFVGLCGEHSWDLDKQDTWQDAAGLKQRPPRPEAEGMFLKVGGAGVLRQWLAGRSSSSVKQAVLLHHWLQRLAMVVSQLDESSLGCSVHRRVAARLCWFGFHLLVSLLCLSVQPTDSQVQQDSSTTAAAAAGGPSSGAGSSRAAAAAARGAGHTRTSSLELGRGGPGQLAAAGSSAGEPGGLSMATLVLQVCVYVLNSAAAASDLAGMPCHPVGGSRPAACNCQYSA